VDTFVFLVIYRGSNDWNERAHFHNDIREIVDRYPQFNTTVFDYDGTIYDLIITVKVELAKAVLITLASMAVVCFFVIPDLKHTGLAILNVVSICFTMLGALGWWGLDYDPVTMITMLMAIGYSVDYSAHICYHHYRIKHKLNAGESSGSSHGGKPVEQMNHILNAVGRPMLEAASSTFICMLPLFFVRIYIVGSFAKTCVSVVVLGLFRGIFVLPVILLLLDDLDRTIPSLFRHKSSNRNIVNGTASRATSSPISNESDLPLVPGDNDAREGEVQR